MTIDALNGWLVQAGLEGLEPTDLLSGYCERLEAAGLPLWRASIGASKLHPQIDGQGHCWIAGQGATEEFYPRAASPEQLAQWYQSPWYWMLREEQIEMRRRLVHGAGTNEFLFLADLAAKGATDYWARIIAFGERGRLGDTPGVATSWSTCIPKGFTNGELALIEATLPAFALAYKSAHAVETARTVASTYLGRDVAERILRGDIERGKAVSVRKVLWLSDLRDFTRITDMLPHDQLLDLLNAYAECVVSILHRHGGEVLKFMGDGMLAVITGDGGDACGRALDAAAAVRQAIDALNERRTANGLPTTGFSLALHEGEVLYGNVGSQDRLDFTVIGPAVNEASRIQGLSRSLDQPVLVSASFASACGGHKDRLVSVGRYALRGVERPQELFTLDIGQI